MKTETEPPVLEPEQSTTEPDPGVELEWSPIPVFDEDPVDPPRARLVGSRFRYTADEDTLEISMKVPHRVLAELKGLSPREQIYVLLRSRGDAAFVETLEDIDLVDSNDFIGRFWQAFQERQEARLGESLSSSTS